MPHILSRRLATIAASFHRARVTGAHLSAAEATAIETDLLACSALARELEAPMRMPAAERLGDALGADRGLLRRELIGVMR